MDEVLLGRPFLKKIGFNLTDHVECVRDQIDNKDINEIDVEKLKIAATKCRGLSYTDGDDDPIGLPEGTTSGIGKESKESIDEQLQRIITEAKDNGISDAGYTQLKHMLESYRDVFRIKLGPDHPAKVAPLLITPVNNAKPYTHQSADMHPFNWSSLFKPSGS